MPDQPAAAPYEEPDLTDEINELDAEVAAVMEEDHLIEQYLYNNTINSDITNNCNSNRNNTINSMSNANNNTCTQKYQSQFHLQYQHQLNER